MSLQRLWRSKKALCTTIMIVAVFVICWIPYCIITVYLSVFHAFYHIYLMQPQTWSLYQALRRIIADIFVANSLVDPFIYALRMREVQKGQHEFLAFSEVLLAARFVPYKINGRQSER